jgi:PAS domain S-box-containing protein
MDPTSPNLIQVVLVAQSTRLSQRLGEGLAGNHRPPIGLRFCPTRAEAGEDLAGIDGADAILLDLTLPGSGGLDRVAQVRAKVPSKPIILLLGSEVEARAQDLVRQGAEDYLFESEIRPETLHRVIRHVVEKHRLQEALGQHESTYRELLALTTDYIYTVRLDEGQPTATSHGPGCVTITGYTAQEFEVDPSLWLRMVHESDQASVLAVIQSLLKGETTRPLEHRIIHKNGSLRWIRNTFVPKRDRGGRLIAYHGLISDITERKQAEEELRTACAKLVRREKALRKILANLKTSHEELRAAQLQLIQAAKMESIGTLAAGVAHEVKNPLQTILMGLDYLWHKLSARDQDVDLALADMRVAAKRADSIVRELLHMSASTRLEMKEQDLNAVLERSLWLVHYELEAARISVVCALAPDLPPVRMDSSKMEQVFINLIMNALQAMAQGGHLTVRTRGDLWTRKAPDRHAQGGDIRFGDPVVVAEIQDTGPGIPEQILPRLFDPFFTTKSPSEGTGLGLSIVKKIVELHSGVIQLENVPEGGTRATLVLKARGKADG